MSALTHTHGDVKATRHALPLHLGDVKATRHALPLTDEVADVASECNLL